MLQFLQYLGAVAKTSICWDLWVGLVGFVWLWLVGWLWVVVFQFEVAWFRWTLSLQLKLLVLLAILFLFGQVLVIPSLRECTVLLSFP